MGGDAIERGLCDQQGGLGDAIALARELAGIRPGAEVILDEYPPRPLFEMPNLGLPLPKAAVAWAARAAGLAGSAPDAPEAAGDGYDLGYLRHVAAAPAKPLLLLAPEAMPAGWFTVP
jgi:ClpP class serine protease